MWIGKKIFSNFKISHFEDYNSKSTQKSAPDQQQKRKMVNFPCFCHNKDFFVIKKCW